MPTVTEILKDERLIETRWFTAAGRDAGTYLHQALQYLDEGVLDRVHLEAHHPELIPQINAYETFLREVKPVFWESETRVTHPTLGYDGGPDRVALCWGRLFVLDIKKGAPLPWHGPQLAAYAEALRAARYPKHVLRRANIYPKGNGSYRFEEHTRRSDWQVFLSALNLWKWRKANGVQGSRPERRGDRGQGRPAQAAGEIPADR